MPVETIPVSTKIYQIEKDMGPLSTVQKILLTTDGSVTSLLEAYCGEKIAISTLLQEIVPADTSQQESLDLPPGETINFRVVNIKNAGTDEVLLHAVSETPLSRLRPEWQADLLRADIPIGRILASHRIEARRELLDIVLVPADNEMSRMFRIPPGEYLLTRTYRIIHNGTPLMKIRETFPLRSFTRNAGVLVKAPARIHLGLIDLHGGLGRVDGGMGIALAHPSTIVEARFATFVTVSGGDPEMNQRALESVNAILGYGGVSSGALVTIHQALPLHSGLGSGTSLALAAARAVSGLYQLDLSPREIAKVCGRGGTSGIGTGAFEYGGFLVDGGHYFGVNHEKWKFSPSSSSCGVPPPPVTARHPFPEEWKILLVIPELSSKVKGRTEQDIFSRYCPVPEDEVGLLCREVLMRILPGVAHHDLDLFSRGINRSQTLGFKKVEISLQDRIIPDLIRSLRAAGAPCAGMSSFGPAVFAVTDSSPSELEQAARETLGDLAASVFITTANNQGAYIRNTD
jgi:beta-ribofuranosylaminobenzene 5'-phosphate synthase